MDVCDTCGHAGRAARIRWNLPSARGSDSTMRSVVFRLAAAVVFGPLVGGCGPALWEDAAPASPTELVIAASQDDVWMSLSHVYSSLGFQATTYPMEDANHRLVGTRNAPLRESVVWGGNDALARCSPTADRRVDFSGSPRESGRPWILSGTANLTLITTLSATNGETRLRTELVAEMVQGHCFTTGLVESRLAEAVRASLDPDYVPAPSTEDRHSPF
jgi:hypothetical protein